MTYECIRTTSCVEAIFHGRSYLLHATEIQYLNILLGKKDNARQSKLVVSLSLFNCAHRIHIFALLFSFSPLRAKSALHVEDIVGKLVTILTTKNRIISSFRFCYCRFLDLMPLKIWIFPGEYRKIFHIHII